MTSDAAETPTRTPPPTRHQLAVAVDGLRVRTDAGQPIVDSVTFDLAAGHLLALIGASGSGKTTTALALLGWANPGTTITAGTVRIEGQPILCRADTDLRRLRSRLVSYVPQDPLQALNPARRIGRQLSEILRAHQRARDADAVIGRALDRARLPTDRRFLRRYPHELSGGQRQRVVIAQALLLEPAVIVLDEPTTGLDAVTQHEFLTRLDRLRAETGAAMVYVTHDVAAIAPHADRIAVLHDGTIVEHDDTRTVLRRPRHPYTRHLLDTVPDPHRPAPVTTRPASAAGPPATSPAVLQVRGLSVTHRDGHQRLIAADKVGLDLAAGSCLALVGASGSGKTTIGRCIAGLLRPDAGTITLRGTPLAPTARRRTVAQRRAIQIVFQNPADSLNPRRTVGTELARVVRYFDTAGDAPVAQRVTDLLDNVRLPHDVVHRYPGQLSGGEQQRVAIARALAADPDVLVCDEITSALDVSVQATVLNLLATLRRELELSLLFITHDLGVVSAIADQVTLLDHGRVQGTGPTRHLLDQSDHPVARRLLAAAPSLSRASAGVGGTATTRSARPQ
ncbi:ABC transporter ATP-binding protein [Micromonospora sp. NPDC050187]|uniref:ABC transporter ATP-binding protein n=1 Tax=Micromonospora sp. NPDC050187 TaxID=3364277 RepID=UPI0037B28B06